MKHVVVTARAEKDLRQLDKPTRERVVAGLRADLAPTPPPDNIDVKPLRGAAPWMRLRIGTYRVLFRALTTSELKPLVEGLPKADRPTEGYLVERIIHRRISTEQLERSSPR
jgi:mRNA-degrading endonuclease RelE of RelBE toxin-antitoxin system